MNIKKEIFIGFVIGIIANFIGCYLYIYFFSDYNVKHTLEVAKAQGILGSIITLGAILNLIAFFLLLQKKQIYKARGVLIATMIAALLIIILKFY